MLTETIEKLKTGEHVTIVALGDSITEATFHTRGRLNWVGLIQEAIFETYGNGAATVINSGKCASSFEESLGRLERDVLRFEPDLVILALGMNDAGCGLVYLPTFKSLARETISIIQDRCGSEVLIRTPNPVVTVSGLPMPPEQPEPGQAWESPERPLRDYSAALVELAEELGCEVVDHFTLWATKEFHPKVPVADYTGLWPRMADAIHPGWEGHLVFYREIAPMLDLPRFFPWEQVE